MEASIVKIGNSQGLIIPKKILHSLGDSTKFNMQIIDGSLLIAPCSNNSSRKNWEKQFSMAIQNGFTPDEDIDFIENEFDNTDWTW